MSNPQPLRSTKDFVDRLDKENELWVCNDPVDPNLELAQIQREVFKHRGPAILFTNVKGTRFPVATNLYGSTKRLDLAFGRNPTEFIRDVADLAMNLMPPNLKKLWNAKSIAMRGVKVGMKRRKISESKIPKITPTDLTQLPQIKSWPEDGGAFVTLPLVYTESPSSGKGNLGMYRVQLFNENRAGMHIQIHRGGGNHYHEAEKLNQPLPVRVIIGGPPALTIAAIAPLPEDIPELVFASLLMGEKLSVGDPDQLGILKALDADFSINGWIPPKKRMPEGPFGDHYGYYSLQHDYPFVEVQSIHHRKDAIYPATVVGRPPQEDHFIAEYLQEILEPLFPIVMHNVKKVWAYEESGVHSLAGAVVKHRHHREPLTAALRILSEGHLSLTKFLLVTDQDCEPKDFKKLLEIVLERADFKKDLFVISNSSQDTLDYTGPRVNEGSKAILIGTGEQKRKLAKQCKGDLHNSSFRNVEVFCPGALCVTGDPYSMKPDLAEELVKEPSIQDFSVVFLLDDAKVACKSPQDFIWHVFTRFEPAGDIYGEHEVRRFHISFTGPVIFDCRMKPGYPDELVEDPDIARAVQEKWGKKIESFGPRY